MAPPNIVECLSATLSSDTNTRVAAELKLKELLAFPEAALALSQLILTQDADMGLRQHSATIVLRKYVTERWGPFFPGFRGNAPPVDMKAQIRHAVFQALSDPNRKIRSLCAHTVSTIASSDWPDEYPDLLVSLINLLSSNSSNSVHGAMQVFTEFVKSDLTEDQILPVLRQLLPVLLNILGQNEQHSPSTRARTVSVFNQCVTALFMVKEQHPQAVKEATASVLPIWLEAFKVLLNIDPRNEVQVGQCWDGLTVRREVYKTLDVIHTSFPRSIAPYLPDFLSASLTHLQLLYSTFVSCHLMESVPPPTSEEDPIDLPQLICPLLDFVSAVAKNGRAKAWFSGEGSGSAGGTGALVSEIARWAQMTKEDEETWATDANAFVAQEEDEAQTYSFRIAAFDLLSSLMDRLPALTCATLQATVDHVVASSRQAREGGDANWWRPLEAGLGAIGSQAESIIECIEDEVNSGRNKPINIEYLLAEVIPNILQLSQFQFLQGRGFVFASQFSKLLPVNLAGHYLEAAVQVIEAPDAGIPVKVSAVKAVHNFCGGTDDAALTPFMPRVAKDLGPFLLSTSDDSLSLVLETLSVVMGINNGIWITVGLAESLVLATLDVWSRNNKDPIVLSILSEIFKALASSESVGVYEVVVQRALPTLSDAIGSAVLSESWIAGSAIDLATSLVQGSPKDRLGAGFFGVLAPPLFKCLGEAEDRDVLSNGVVCLTAVIRADCAQLVSYKDPSTGRSGLDNVLSLVAKLLQNQDEWGGLAVGDLIIHLLRRAGESILPVLPELLQAMVSRMLTAKTATFLQSLIIPFAFLIYNQPVTILELLENTTIQNRSGLDILIQTWCENAETIQGFWPSRISHLALAKLYMSERPSLQHLMVKGDIVVKPETRNVIMTRSRTKMTPHEFTSIPFPVKALKILLHDLQSQGDSATITAAQQNFEADSDDGDEEWDDEEKLDQGATDEAAFLSDLLGPKGLPFDNDDVLNQGNDEDLENDPVYQMDMNAQLLSFFRDCASKNVNNFNSVVGQMAPEEVMVIKKIVQQ